MKKFLLLLVAAVLVGGLVISCTQPSSYDITLTPGSAPAVDGTKIVAEQLVNSILVKWDAAEDAASYTIFRKEVGAEGPIDATLVLKANASTTTSTKGVPYYQDTAVADGKTYQYGISSTSFKEGTDVVLKSEVVWQEETDTSKFVKVTAIAEGLVKLPATPTYTASKIDSDGPAPTNGTNFVDKTFLTFSGLLPGYTYIFTPQFTTDANVTTPSWGATGGSLTYSWSIGDYVDNGEVLYSEITETGATNQATASYTGYNNYGFRVLVQIDLEPGAGYYGSTYEIELPPATTNVPSGRVVATPTTAVSITP